MGEMLSLIAHQWRQPLSEVSAIFMELESASKFGKASREMIADSAQEADKLLCYMSRTIDDFRHFFKPSKDKEHFCIHDACQEALSLSSALLKNAHIDLHVKVESHTDVEGYPNEYAQVVLNLLINAKEALQSRKTPNPSIVLEVTQTKEGKSCVRISDNAGGIDASVLPRIFEPFESTKESSGIGIGLNIAHSIVTQNGGNIDAYNENGGAVIEVTFPLYKADDGI